ncbi:MAG: FAD-dependent monooxygenase [Gammaproteobacteria bacterium]|nr:FAD-dependent monooxygenase [Gammaproteobacteria bacterium]MCH9743624.1 FAD-dependent monooxygenase [Gammaproteobacteria bacterium]
MKKHTQVLIVGAGPTGLTAAFCLRRRGIDCVLIDKRECMITSSNAAGVHARTLELWKQFGIVEQAIALGNKVKKVCFYSKQKELFQVDFSHIDSEFEYALLLPQTKTEQIMRSALAQYDLAVLQSHECVSLQQDAHKISASIKDPSGDVYTVTADYVIGADGFHSVVREAAEIPFQHVDYDGHFMMTDVEIKAPEILQQQITVSFDKEGMLAVFPMQAFARVVMEYGHDSTFKGIKDPTLDTFKQITEKRCYFPVEYGKQTWSSTFYVHEGLANAYRAGRMFLAGDAAHVHSPAGGQGMNLGIQDAHCLAEKLVMAIQGGGVGVLDQYQQKRRPIAQQVVKMTSRMLRGANLQNDLLIKLRNSLLPLIASNKYVNQKIATSIAMLDY